MDSIEAKQKTLLLVSLAGSLPLLKDRICKYPLMRDAFLHNLGGNANFNLRPIIGWRFFCVLNKIREWGRCQIIKSLRERRLVRNLVLY